MIDAAPRDASGPAIPRRAPASTWIRPEEPRANAIHTFRAGSRSSRGSTVVPTPVTPSSASGMTSRRSADAITVRTPDHAAIFTDPPRRGP